MTSRWFIPLLLIVCTAATFAPVVRNDFVIQDDPHTIAENPRMNPPSLEGVIYYWKNAEEGLYIPMTYTYWSALASVSRSPALFHAGSVVIHVLSVLVVYCILVQIFNEKWAACVGALWFGLHPLQVESVAWASGGKDVLAGLLSLIVIQQYLKFISADKPQAALPWVRYGLVVLALAAGMLAKPSTVVAPVVAWVIDVLLVRKNTRAAVKSLLPLVLLTIPCIAWSRNVQTIWESTITPLWMRPLVAGDALAFYVYKLVWPISLTNLYGRTPWAVRESGVFYFAWIVPVLLGMILSRFRKQVPAVLAGGMILLVALLPVLGFTPFMFQLYSTVADHYMYLPMLGASVIIAALVMSMRRYEWTPAIVAVVLCGFAVRSILQARVWRSSVTLYSQAVEYNPSSVNARGLLANSLARAGRYEEAIPHFEMAVNAQPMNPQARLWLGMALNAAGRTDEGEQQLAIARRLASPATTQ